MKMLFRLALIAALFTACCSAQTATVTFYSQSLSVKSGAAFFLLPKSEQSFGGLPGGWVLEGPQRLARVRSGRFATFKLNPGEHSFTDSNAAGTSKPVVINAKGGGQYCIRLFARMINMGVLSIWENQIAEVPCELARREAAHLKPINIKRVDPAVRAEFDTAPIFPGETPSQTSSMKSPPR